VFCTQPLTHARRLETIRLIRPSRILALGACVSLQLALFSSLLAQQTQNPSPMVEPAAFAARVSAVDSVMRHALNYLNLLPGRSRPQKPGPLKD